MTAAQGTLACALAVCAGAPALAETVPEPPLWAYLAECSAVFGAVAQTDGYGGATEGEILRAADASAAFLVAAEREAGAAGQADPKGDVASIMTYLTERWDNRIDRFFSIRSNLDWIGYCGRIGRENGVLPLPG